MDFFMLLYGFVKVATWVAQKTPLLITRNVFVHNLSFPFLVFYVLPGRAKFCIWGQKWDTLNMVALLRKTVRGRLKDASTEEERLKRACTVHAQCTHSVHAHHLLTQRLTVLQRSRKGKHIGTQRQDEPSNQDGPP